MRKLKMALTLVVALLLVFAAVGCQAQTEPEESSEEPSVESSESGAPEEPDTPEEPAEKEWNIGIAMYGTTNEFSGVILSGIEAACEELGIKYKVTDGNWDVNTQIGQVEALIAEKVDGIVFVPVDATASAPCVEKAAAAGIPIVGVNSMVESDKLSAYVGSDDVSGGESIMEWIATQLGGKGNIVLMHGPFGHSAEVQRTEGVKKALEKYPDIKLLVEDTAEWSRDKGQTLMENWLATYGADQIDAVLGENDEMALGAMNAIKNAGVTKKIWIIGIDGLADAVAAIEAGTYDASFLQDGYQQGYTGVETLIAILNGEDTEKEVWIPFVEINQDNYTDFQ